MKDDIYEVLVFNDQYGVSVRCRSDVDRQGGFKRLGNGFIVHTRHTKNQIRYGYVLAKGAKREMTILADSLKALLDGLNMQTESRQMFAYVNSTFGDFDNLVKFGSSNYDQWKNRILDYKVNSVPTEFISTKIFKKIKMRNK